MVELIIVNGRNKHNTNSGISRKYHIWNKDDTLCKMYKSGGLGDIRNIKLDRENVYQSKFSRMRQKGKICANCVSDRKLNLENNKKSINSIEPKEFLYEDIYEGEE